MALILIVDDEFAIAELLRAMAEDAGHQTLLATDGRAGLVAMRARHPDLIFTDTMMPGMGGPEMVRAMMLDPDLASIPVIAMSAMPMESVGRDYPAYVAFLHKPFRLMDVNRILLRLLPTG